MCFAVTMVAVAQNAEIVKVRGRGIGTNKLEALNDAFRDAVERAVGFYIDAEQLLKNDELVKDQILTQSNAYIENYATVKESRNPDGLVEIQILASVRKTALTRKISMVMPAKTFALGGGLQQAHARISTREKRNADGAALLANALEGLDPYVASMECSLASSDVAIKEKRNPWEPKNTVAANWLFRTGINQKRFLEATVPRLQGVLAQISLAPPRSVIFPVKPASFVNVGDLIAKRSTGPRHDGRGNHCVAEAITLMPSLQVEKLSDESAAFFLLITGGNNFRTAYSGIIYEIDNESAKVMADWFKTVSVSPTFAVSLLDAGGGMVYNGKIRPLGPMRKGGLVSMSPPPSRKNHRRNNSRYHWFVLAPWLTSRGGTKIEFESYSWQEFVLPQDAVPEVKNMRIEIIQ